MPQAFWDRIAPRYARQPVADPAAYEAKLTDVIARLHPRDRVLEIGCGTGSTALRMAPHSGHVTASDISERMIEIAHAKLVDGAPANVDFVKADAADKVDGAPFDVICAFSLLHLVPDLSGLLMRVRSQIAPDGLFLSKTVCLKDGPVAVRLFVRLLRAVGIAPPIVWLSRDDVEAELRKAGFEIEEVRFFGKGRLNPFIVARRAEG
jgi:2-polyprenyl-3-methyl-5-hydroxy-6-metoxy-1,4-benzoquinol methylase